MVHFSSLKKIGIAMMLISIIVGCESNEKKADKLIKEYLFRTLYDFKSYEPILTEIDSAFTSLYMDSAILHHAGMIDDYTEKISEENSTIKENMESLSLIQAQKGVETSKLNQSISTSESKIAQYKENIQLHIDSIKMSASNLDVKFEGWHAKHRFRANNEDGVSDLAELHFYFDERVKKIVHAVDWENPYLTRAKIIIDYALRPED